MTNIKILPKSFYQYQNSSNVSQAQGLRSHNVKFWKKRKGFVTGKMHVCIKYNSCITLNTVLEPKSCSTDRQTQGRIHNTYRVCA